MKDRFRATRAFWRSFGKLPAQQQRRAREAFLIFKQNPFDSCLGSHKIQKLSARYGRVIYAAEIEANLRVVFYMCSAHFDLSVCPSISLESPRLRSRARVFARHGGQAEHSI